MWHALRAELAYFRPWVFGGLAIALIGCGGRGSHDMSAFLSNQDVQMVAVCDVVAKKRDAGKAKVDKQYGSADCETYLDLRELLTRDDIDAVLIATGVYKSRDLQAPGVGATGIVRAIDTPPIELTIEADDRAPVNGSDAVFASVRERTVYA